MNTFSEVTYSPLSQNKTFKVKLENDICIARSEDDQYFESKLAIQESKLELNVTRTNSQEIQFLSYLQAEYLFGKLSDIQEINFCGNYELVISRSDLMQLPQLWHHKRGFEILPEKWIETNGTSHPVRPKPHEGYVYRRYVPQLEKTISYRLIKMSDLDTFHEWHNQPRVSFFWELNKPKEELKGYIEKGLQDPHQIPMIVEIDGEPVGYFEMYWVREDRLGPYYESDAFDRGFHFLIGNKKFLGHLITDSIIKSCLHFLYLDDPRTRRVMAEPRHDNQKVLKYAEASIGWRKVKIFDFPHKRAWLLENSREHFFGRNAL